MRFACKLKNRCGEIKRQLLGGDCAIDVITRLLDAPNIAEIISVKNIKDIPLNEQISLCEARSY
jgi:hypothetical protein